MSTNEADQPLEGPAVESRDLEEATLKAAAQVNQLIIDLWLATERGGPRYEQFDLTSKQHAVLGLIVARPEASPRELADALGVTKGAISQHLARLEREGYLTRRRSKRDARVQVLLLGAHGEEYRDSILEFERYTASRLARLKPREVAEVVAALTKLRDAFAS